MKHSWINTLKKALQLNDFIVPAIFLLFTGFIMVNTIGFIRKQNQEAFLINIAGRQRMLSHKVAKELFAHRRKKDRYQPVLAELAEKAQAMAWGGKVRCPNGSNRWLNVRPAPTPQIRAKIVEQKNVIDKLIRLVQSEKIIQDPRLEDPMPHSLVDKIVNFTDRIQILANEGLLMYLDHIQAESRSILLLNCFLFVILTLFGIGLVLLLIDRRYQVQQLTRTKESLVHSTDAKTTFLTNISHEIRTPLNAIIGIAGLLQKPNQELNRERLHNSLKQSADSLLTLIDDVLDLSKIEAGKLKLHPTLLNVRELMGQIQQMMEHRAFAKGLYLDIVCGPTVPEFTHVDGDRLRQILLNLVSNAVKFTSKGGIQIRVEFTGSLYARGYLDFQVSDTGIGIAADRIDSIFEDYVQADPSISSKFGGTGLGLAISKKLVELMGGSIIVTSEVGKGSAFKFSIECGWDPELARELRNRSFNLVRKSPHLEAI
jgi:signal transduction histidine kinase